MPTLGVYYLNTHTGQFDGSVRAGENCTPAAGANGARASTGGRVNKSAAGVRLLVKRWEETSPDIPGWSLFDLDLAMSRLGVGFVVRSGSGWASALTYLNSDFYLAIQGDSDQFSNSTCSGAFNGDHCIGVHPAKILTPRGQMRWIDDGICKTGRWEYERVIQAYARDLNTQIRFGAFTTKVPRVQPVNLIDSAPTAIGPQPLGATSWVRTLHLARLWEMDDHGIVRPVFNPPNGFTFTAWAGPNLSQMWAPGPNAAKEPDKQVFRKVLGPVHRNQYIRVTDAGSVWQRD